MAEEMKGSHFGWVLVLIIATAFFTYFAAARGWGVAPLKDPKVVHSYRNKEPFKGQDYEAYARNIDTLVKKYNDSLRVVQKKFNHTRDSLKSKGYNLATYKSGEYSDPYDYETKSESNPYYIYVAESSPYRRRRYSRTSSRRSYSSSNKGTRSRNKYSTSSYPSSRRGTYGSNRRSSSNNNNNYTSRNSYSSSARSSRSSRSSRSFRNTSSRSFRGGSRRGGK